MQPAEIFLLGILIFNAYSLTLELNRSAQRSLPKFFYWGF